MSGGEIKSAIFRAAARAALRYQQNIKMVSVFEMHVCTAVKSVYSSHL